MCKHAVSFHCEEVEQSIGAAQKHLPLSEETPHEGADAAAQKQVAPSEEIPEQGADEPQRSPVRDMQHERPSPSPGPAATQRGPREMVVVAKHLKVREGYTLTSRLRGTLFHGTRVRALETYVLGNGMVRMRVAEAPSTASAEDDPSARGGFVYGWVTARKSRLGNALLREAQPASEPAIPHSHRSIAPSARDLIRTLSPKRRLRFGWLGDGATPALPPSFFSSVAPATGVAGQPASWYASAAERMRASAETVVAELAQHEGIDVLVGRALDERGLGKGAASDRATLQKLMAEWDPNRDGSISRMEFRHNVRSLLRDPKLDSRKCDALFESLDRDGSGALDLDELRTALRTIHERASKANALASAVHTRAERWRDLGDDARAVEQLTAEVERLARELASNASAAALAVQLGGVLKRKGVRLGELIARWGGDDNIVDRSEFEAQVGELGLKASVEEIGRLFDALDKDGGGTLDGHELKHALKDLVDEADATTKRVRQMERAVLERAKSAKDSQDAWKAKEVALLRTEAAEAERQRLAAEAREAAAAKEKAAQRAALEEKRQAAALEKAAFEARVEERSIRKHQRKTEKGAAAAAPTK